MQTSPFMSREELAELTGKVRFSAQAKVLQDLRIPFILNAANRPIVARAAVERILGVSVSTTAAPPMRTWQSNVS
nr:MAG TPA: protein of unknown function (DUF4224) [Caudoviricetes sp.]